MAITYQWIVQSLDCAPTESGLNDVVKRVHWAYQGIDTDNTTYTVYGLTFLDSPNPDDFIAYPDLNISIVGGWLNATNDTTVLQASIAKNIADIQNPPLVPLPLP